MALRKIVLLFMLVFTVSMIQAQESDVIDFDETIPLFLEVTSISVPEGWEYEVDEDFGIVYIYDEDTELELAIFDSLELDDTLEIDLDMTVDDAMVAAYEGIYDFEIDADDVEIEEDFAEGMTLGIYEYSDDNITFLVKNTDIETIFLVDVYNTEEDDLTDEQLEIARAIILTVRATEDIEEEDDAVADDVVDTCVVTVEESDSASLRVGPGTNRTVVAFLAVGEFDAIGQATADDGTQWFRLDKEEAAPNSSANEIWVVASEVIAEDSCDDLVLANAPQIIPGAVGAPGTSSNGEPIEVNSGDYTLYYAETFSANCVGFGSVTLVSEEYGYSAESVSISVSGDDLFFEGSLLALQDNGQYVVSFTYDDGFNEQFYLTPTGSDTFQGQLIFNFTADDGTPCSGTLGVTIR